MKDAEDDGEIVIKSMFCHLWREKGASYARHLPRDLGSRKNNSSMCCSAHHDTFSADDGDKHGRSGYFSSRTSACRPRNTDPWGGHDVSSCVIRSTTVIRQLNLLGRRSRQRIFGEFKDVPQERLSKRTGKQFDGDAVSQVMKEIFEVTRMFPQDDSQQCTAKENEMQPLIMEEIVEEVRLTPHEQISERICEQIMEVSIEQLIEVVKISHQDRISQGAWKRSLMFPIHGRLRRLWIRQRSWRWCKSFHLSACSSVVWSSLSIWQLRASWKTLLKWCDWFLRSVI